MVFDHPDKHHRNTSEHNTGEILPKKPIRNKQSEQLPGEGKLPDVDNLFPDLDAPLSISKKSESDMDSNYNLVTPIQQNA